MAWKTNEALRARIYEYIRAYAKARNGPTPTIREIACALKIPWSTAHYHVTQLVAAQKLGLEDGKIRVIGARWLDPDEKRIFDKVHNLP